MSSNYSSSSLNRGGGNSLNLIRIPSINEVKNIIVSSDLNGTITPGNMNTWQIYDTWTTWWTQNNSNDFVYLRALNVSHTELVNKNETWEGNYWNKPICFRPVIEYKE